MVGIFSGRLLGLTGGSGDVLGGSGLLGSGSLGRGGDNVYVNAATGNLVLSKQDEFLVGKGADASVSRTYNSLTTLADDNGDDWRQSTDRRVFFEADPDNQGQQILFRVSADGSKIRYNWNASWRNGSGAYVATDGSGAYDTIIKSGAEWIWYDGDTSARESYYDETAAAGLQGKIKTLKDAAGLGVIYAYDASNRLSTITTYDGSWLRYDYADATSVNITQVVTGYTDLKTSTAQTLTRTRYGYDASNRLSTVTADLSPEDSSISDGATYVTTYGYDAAGHVTSIAQSDGSLLTITYESTSATARVTSLVETASSGVTRSTSFAYAASTLFSGGVTSSITDPSGQVTVLETDGAGNLCKITAPPATSGAAQQVVQFAYNANGDLTSVIDAGGKTTSYGSYTVDGQARTITDTLGNVVTRVFGSIDRTTGAVTVYSEATPYVASSDGSYISYVVLSETSKGVDQSGTASDETTRYVYDKYGGLRYTISPEGRVTEQVRSSGVVVTVVEYPEALYTAAGTPSETDFNGWRDALPDRSSVVKVNYGYDTRFNIRQVTTYGSYTVAGGGQTTDGSSTTFYTYDQAGQLLSQNASGYNTTTYVYDGIGRVKAVTDVNGGTTTYVYNDTATTTTVTYASGYVVTQTYNKAGDLISQTDSGANTTGGTTSYAYDKLGRVRVRIDAVGATKTYYIYDNVGRKVGEVDNAGYVTEYRYDSVNRLVGTIHYRNATTFSLTTLADPNAAVTMSAVRPGTPTGQDISSWTVYDSEGRVRQMIAGDGSTTIMTYDAAGRLQKTIGYYYKLSTTVMDAIFASAPTAVTTPASASTRDGVSRNFYDDDGLLIGTLDGEGYLTRNEYDNAGRVVVTTSYATTTASADRASGSWTTLLAGVGTSAQDRVTHLVYDGRGLLRFKVDSLNQVTTYQYAGHIDKQASVQVYTTALPTTSDYTFDNVKALVFGDASRGIPAMVVARTSYNIYDAAGRLAYAIDAAGSVTSYAYDNMGHVTRMVAYATSRTTTSQPALATMDAWSTTNITNTANRITRTFYTERGEAAYVVDGQGYVTLTNYDADGQATSARRWTTPITVDDTTTFAQVAAAATGASETQSWLYDSLGRVTRATNGLGNSTTYTYLGATSLVSTMTRAANGAAQEQAVTATTFDGAGHAVQVTDASGVSEAATSTVSYDGRGLVASKTDGRNSTASYAYDLNGRVKSVTNAAGGVTTYAYNAFDEVWKVTDPAGANTYSWYDQLGRVVAVEDAQNYLTTTSYTVFGEVASVTRYMTAVTGTPAMSTVPTGTDTSATTSFLYDKMGRVLSSSDALGNTESYTYNVFGDRLSSTNKLGAVTTYTYDKVGRLTRQGVILTNAPTSNDKAAGNYSGGVLQSGTVVTGVENVTTYGYDGYGNVLQKVEGYATAVGGTVTAMRTTNYIYDAANQLTSVTHDAVTVVADDMVTYSTVTPTETYAYDKRGNVIKAVDAGGATTYTYYDDLDRKTVEMRQVAAAKWVYSTYAYDANDNLLATKVYDTAITTTPVTGGAAPAVPAGTWRETDFTYDGLNRVLTAVVVSNSGNDILSGSWNGSSYVTSTGNLITTYQYDADGNAVKVIDPNGGVTWSWYDKLSRKTAQLDSGGYLTKWIYDAEGNALEETRYATKFSSTPSLTAPPGVGTSVDDRTTQFAYDLNGNRTSETRLNVDAWTVNTSNGALDAAATTSATITYAYNALGQVISKSEPTGISGTPAVQIATYTYDKTGRLISETRAAFNDANGIIVTPTTSYVYDALGDLVTTTQAGTSSGTYTTQNRVTVNRYGEGGRLLATTDAENNVHQYYYDVMGRRKKDAYNRIVNADTTVSGATATTTTTVAEAQASTYDLAGRVLSQSIYSTVGGTFKRVGLTSYTYNSFDQVLTQGQGSSSSTDISAGSALYQVTNQYDSAGRLVGTNAGDGIWKFFGYDAKGNQTAAITSAGYAFTDSTGFAVAQSWTGDAAYGAQVNGTYTVYDKRGMATQVVEEGRDLSASVTGQTLTTSRTYNAFGEVKSETNALGAVIIYTYNTMGRMIRSESPAVSITDETGASYWIKPSEDYYYDLGGRRIAVRDANGTYATTGTNAATATSKSANTGNLTSLALLAGTGYDNSQALVSTEFHADAGKKQVLYDIMGDARVVQDELYDSDAALMHVEELYYNRLGQLVTDKHNRASDVSGDSTRLIHTYVYDQFGQTIQHDNNQTFAVNTTTYVSYYYSYQTTSYLNYLEKTRYDGLGRITSRTDASGYVTASAYAWNGTLATSINGVGVTFGGWVETDTMANGLTAISRQDIYNREVSSKDLGGHQDTATFDAAGRMITKGGSAYTWYNTGLLSTSAAVTGALGSDTWDRKLTTYGYDKVGNRKSEVTVNDGSQLVWSGGSYDYYQQVVGYSYTLVNESATYDALGRLTVMTAAAATLANGTIPAATINEYYDAAGNIRRTKSTHALLNNNGGVSGTTTDDYWFRYDSMNRLVTDKGSLSGAAGAAGTTIVRGANVANASVAQGQDYVYDAASQRIAAIHTDYVLGYRIANYNIYVPGHYQETRENDQYDGAGRINAIKITQGTAAYETFNTSTGMYEPPSSIPVAAAADKQTPSRSVFGYDLMGRQITQTDYDAAVSTVIYSRTAQYALNGFLLSDSTTTKKYENGGSTSLYTTSSNYSATSSSGQYLLGAVGSVTSLQYKNNSYQNGSSTTNTYQWWDGAVQGTIVYKPDTGSSTTNTTTFSYDANGTLKSVYIADPRPRTVTYQTNGDGQIIKRDEADGKTDGDPHEIWYRFAGKELGYVGNNGPSGSDMTEASSIDDRQVYQGNGAFRNGASSVPSNTNFAQSTAGQINSYSQSSAAGSYVVQGDGETLRSIAQSLYGDSSLWYKIADANGITGDMALNEGQRLSLPAGVSRTHNNATTLTPYDANSAIGNVSPTTPQPPKKAGCGVFGQILLAVISIAVTVVLAPVIGYAPAAIVGNVVSQGVGIATGIQDKFSFESVAMTAVTVGVGKGLDKLGVFSSLGIAGGSGVAGAFSAAARGALTSAVSQGIGVATGLQDNFDWSGVAGAAVGAGLSSQIKIGGFGGTVLRNMAGGLANAASRSVINGTDFGDNIIAALPDMIANTIGNLVAGAMAGSGTRRSGPQLAGNNSVTTPGAPSGVAAPNASGSAGREGRDDQSDAGIVVIANRLDRDLIWAMKPYQWERYFQEYGERTFEAGERWALRQQEPTRAPTAASVRPVSAQVASASQGSFWSGVKDGFGSTMSGMWGGLKYTVTHPLQAPKMIIDGFAHGLDSALEAENTPAYVQLRRLGHSAATMSAYDWGHVTGSTAANVGLFVVTDGAAGVVGRLASMTRGAGVLADVSIAAESVATVDTKLALQGVTDRAVADLAANPSLARELMSPGSYQHLVEGTNLAPASYGKAVERLTARYVEADPELSQILQYQSRPFVSTPDFFGYEGYNLRPLDITTQASEASHLARPYGSYTDYVYHPGLPSNLVFPR